MKYSQLCSFIFYDSRIYTWSERRDSNTRPLPPQGSTLANCATPRYHMRIISDEMLKICLERALEDSNLSNSLLDHIRQE
jgi:hypothetical protein